MVPALREFDDSTPVLVDSLGSWLTLALSDRGLLEDDRPRELAAAADAWLADVRALGEIAAQRGEPVVVVAEEAGLGPVPAGALTRRWLDAVGDAKQALAARAERVVLALAGRALELPPGAAHDPLATHGDRLVPPGARDFAVNVERTPLPDWLRAALTEALDGVGRYPDADAARAPLAALHGRPGDEALPLNGAAEGFWLIAAASAPEARAACIHPSFTEPERALRAHGRRVERVVLPEHDDWALDPAAVPEAADLVAIGNPTNPTGRLHPAADVASLARPGRLLVVDETFMPFAGERESLAARRDLPGLVVLRSLTKAYAIPGLRAGYLLAAPDLTRRLDAMRQPWSVNGLALAAMRAIAASPAGERAAAVADRRARLQETLDAIPGARVWDSAANFLLARAREGPAVHRRLLERGFAVRPCDSIPGLSADHLRVTVRDDDSNRRLAAAFEEAMCVSA